MSNNWEKRYSFRLTKEDDNLGKFLEKVPNSSEAIRKMLNYAYRSMFIEQKEKEQVNELKVELKKEIEKNRELQHLQHQEVMKRLEEKLVVTSKDVTINEDLKEDKAKEEKLSEQALDDSASAMLSSFGINMN